MADSTIGKAFVQIVPSADGITEKMNTLFGGKGDEVGKSVGSEFGSGMLNAITGFGSKITSFMSGLASEISGMAMSAFSSLSDVAAYGDDIDKMSQKMGLSAEAYQEWQAVMQHSGTSMEAMQSSMKTLANAAETNSDAFKALGITEKELAKLSQEELFEKTIAELQKMDDVTERTYLSGKLLGRGATELGALLNTSAEETEAMKQRVHELGGVLTDDAVKASAQFQDNLQDLKTALTGTKNEIIASFLPSVNMITEGFTKMLAGESGAEELIEQGINQFLGRFKSVAETVLANIRNFITNNSDTIIGGIVEIGKGAAEGFAEFLPQIVPAVSALIPQIVEAFGSIGQSVVSTFPAIIDAVISLASEIAALLPTLLPQIASTIVTALPEIVNGITEMLPVLIDTVVQVVDTIAALLPEIIPPVFEAIVNAIPMLAQTIADNLPVVIKTLTDLVMSVAQLIPDILPVLVPALTQGMTALIEGVAAAMEELPELISAMIDISMAMVDAILDNLPLFLDCGIQIIKAFGKAIYDHFPEIVEKFGELLVKIVDTIEGWYSKIWNAWGNLWDKIVNGIEGGWDDFMHEVYEWGDSVLEALGEVWDDIKDFWGGLWDNMVDIGGDLIGGIVEGLKEGWENLKESVTEFGDTVVETFCDIFDINSPSKIMEDMIGKNLALGIGEGFADEMNTVTKGMGKSVSGVIDELSGYEMDADISRSVTYTQTAVSVADTSADPVAPTSPTTFVVQLDSSEIARVTFSEINALLGKTTTLQARGYA